jgi:DNA-binding transcriptional LysR family regulator
VVDVGSEAGIELVARGEIDVAVVANYGAPWNHEGVHLHHLVSDPLVVVLPDDHPLASDVVAAEPIDLLELRNEAWVCGAPGQPHRVQLDDSAAERGFIPMVPFQTESYDVAQALAVAGVAVAFLPRMAVRHYKSTVVRNVMGPLSREVYAVLPSSIDHVPLASQFLRLLTHAGELGFHS